MTEREASKLQALLDLLDELTFEEKEMLFDIVYPRLIRERRIRLAEEVAEARQAYRQGQVRRGGVDDLVAEL
jgi:hypothetical protein